MIEEFKKIHDHRRAFHKMILDQIDKYIYREERYNTNFALVAVYSKEPTAITPQELKQKLRKTDTLITLNENLAIVIFDAVAEDVYVKAAENLNTLLKEMEFKNNFFLSVASSDEVHHNYRELTNKLCDRLEYVIENRLFNTVIYQDYII
jgi:hypothetical protein